MRRSLVVVGVWAALVPFRVAPADAVSTAWVGPLTGDRYMAFGGDPEPFEDQVSATIRFAADQQGVTAVATYDCSGDFIAGVLDCTRVPTADLNTNSAKFPVTLHGTDLVSYGIASFAASLSNGRRLECDGANGPSESLPEDQSSHYQIAGVCTVM